MNKKGQFFPLGDDNPVSKITYVNWTLIVINIIAFIFSLYSYDAIIKNYGFTPASFSIITIFTSMFLHGGLAHIGGNLWFLYIFGDNIEDKIGHLQYLFFYLISGIAATFTHFLVEMNSSIPAVGASGAISGVLGAYLVFFPHADVYVSGSIGHSGKIKAIYMLGIWFLMQLLSATMGLFGSNGGGIAFFAHIGGFVFGVIVAFVLKKIYR